MGRLSAREFAEWEAYWELEPFGPLRDDYRSGVLASLTAAVHTPKGQPLPRPADFFPTLEAPRPPQTPEEQLRIMLSMFPEAKRDGDGGNPPGQP